MQNDAERGSDSLRAFSPSFAIWLCLNSVCRRSADVGRYRRLPPSTKRRKLGAWCTMSRKDSPYVLDDLWIEKRKDGKSPGIWQIRTYNKETRSRHYISTDSRDIEDAKRALDIYHAERSLEFGLKDGNAVVALLCMQYEQEYASKTISASSLSANIRIFVSFLKQDEVGIGARLSDLNPQVFERFRIWRMNKHQYEITWQHKLYQHSSSGVVGETVSKNLDDVRAALNYAVSMGRVTSVPKVPRVKMEYRSPPRDRVLSSSELGSIIGYASFDPPMLRWVLLMLATAMRPEAALKLNVSAQFRAEHQLLDLHPFGAPRTKKRNPTIPVIPEFLPWLLSSNDNFVTQGPSAFASMKRRWRTMRRELNLGREVVSKTIRHTVGTRLRSLGAPFDQITALMGHQESNSTTAVYAKYDPNFIGEVKSGLSAIWNDAIAQADAWREEHCRDMSSNRKGVFKREAGCQPKLPLCDEYFSQLDDNCG